MNQSHVIYQESHCLYSQSQHPDLSSFGFDFNIAARWRLHRSGYMLVWGLLGARSAPGSLSLRVGRVRLQLISASIGVRVVLWQGRRVLASQGGVWRNQTLLHPLLLLHPSVLEPNFDLKVEFFLLRIIPTGRQLKLTWVSFSCSAAAISILLARVRYLLKWNSFSSSVSCLVEKFVLPVLLIPPPCPP